MVPRLYKMEVQSVLHMTAKPLHIQMSLQEPVCKSNEGIL